MYEATVLNIGIMKTIVRWYPAVWLAVVTSRNGTYRRAVRVCYVVRLSVDVRQMWTMNRLSSVSSGRPCSCLYRLGQWARRLVRPQPDTNVYLLIVPNIPLSDASNVKNEWNQFLNRLVSKLSHRMCLLLLTYISACLNSGDPGGESPAHSFWHWYVSRADRGKGLLNVYSDSL